MNQAPTISGAPSTTVIQNAAYSFTPTANDPDGDTLTFSVSNLPTWGTFDTTTGELSGIPDGTDVGTTSAISISVSDGVASDSLAPFDLTVARFSYSLDVPNVGTVKYTLLAENAGRVSWYRGTTAQHNRIAYDGKSQVFGIDSRVHVYTMNADGSDKTCVTCNMPEFETLYQEILAQRQAAGDDRLGFWIGQPEWHPDGVHVIVQVENLNSPHLVSNFMSFGVDNDLWIVDVETRTASRIWTTDVPRHAALHPRFSEDGSKLIFAQRVLPNLINVWDGWGIIAADFDISNLAPDMISNATLIAPDARGFYETTGFVNGSNLDFSYSFTPFENNTVLPYVAEGRRSDVTGSTSQLVVDFADAWDEKPRFSPSTNGIVVMSSAFDTTWKPADGPATLQTDLYLGGPGGPFQRLTFFNDLDRYATRVLVTDHEWNQAGDQLVVQAIENAGGSNADAWLVELPQTY